MTRLRAITGLLILGSASALGCKDASQAGVALSGRVEFQGKPLATGSIYFSPEADAPGRGAHAEITAGHFSIPSEDGPFPGRMVVQVVSLVEEPNPIAGGKPRMTNQIPEKYNLKSELRVEIPNRKSYSYLLNLP